MSIDQNTHREAFDEYASRIIEFESVEEIILFGSVARKSHGVNSDVDVFIKVENMSEKDLIEEKAFETSLEKEVSITPVIKKKKSENSLMEDIREEGVKYVRS